MGWGCAIAWSTSFPSFQIRLICSWAYFQSNSKAGTPSRRATQKKLLTRKPFCWHRAILCKGSTHAQAKLSIMRWTIPMSLALIKGDPHALTEGTDGNIM